MDNSIDKSKIKPIPSVLGGGCIIACACVGAGMLGLPSAGAGVWFIGSMIVLVITMLVMITSGCLLLEALQSYPYKSSFSTLTKDLLGKKVQVVTNLTVYFVGAILLYAYITSSGLIIQGYTSLNAKFASILFVLCFSIPIWHSTRVVDRVSIILLTFMVLSFTFSMTGLSANLDARVLFALDDKDLSITDSRYVFAFIPVALASFGYQHSVSSMRDYYLDVRKTRNALVLGVVLAFVFYTIWLFAIFGNIPRDSFTSVLAQGGNIDALLNNVRETLSDKHWLANVLSAFSAAAILSSFIAVGLGLFDFLADAFQFDASTTKGRNQTWAVTFLPPLICSLLLPFGFLTAIGFAASAAAFWACIIPAILVKKFRNECAATQKDNMTLYRVPGNDWTLVSVALFGVVTIIVHLLNTFSLLPVFGQE
ncbi:TPA: aromatic amino acid transport family protein [Vibrio vulnificus]